MSRFLNGIKSFVHSISTNDHYASYDPSRPQGLEDTAPLASASDERRSSSSSLGKSYVPGMRSAQMSSSNLAGASSGRDSIPLTDMTPIPSAELSWERIDTWIEQNYPELYDQLLEGATKNDLNDLEHDLDVALPQDVRESFTAHDGQEPGGKPTGVFFGIGLLDLEGIGMEWSIWRRMALKVEELSHRAKPQASSSSSPAVSTRVSAPASIIGVPGMNLGWVDRQKCCPPDTVQQVFFHPAWVPLAKDRDGNNIAVDLAPGPKGRYGQVILFGRDFDTKYVVAPSWGDFLAQFAADLESGQSFIDDDIENAVFAFKAPSGQLVSYFSVLRNRVERTLPKQSPTQQQQQRRSMSSIPSVSKAPSNSGRVTPRLISPINSSASLPLKESKPRSRTPQALSGQLNEVDLNETAKVASPADSDDVDPKSQPNDRVKESTQPRETSSKPEDDEEPKALKDKQQDEVPMNESHKDLELNDGTASPAEQKVEAKAKENATDEAEKNVSDEANEVEDSGVEPSADTRESSTEQEATNQDAEAAASAADTKPNASKPKKKSKKKVKN